MEELNPNLLSELKETIKEAEMHNAEVLISQDKLPLYDYQEAGRKFINEHGRCILADDMGLGKTLQALASTYDQDTDRNAQVLIITPKSAKAVWRNEIRKWLKEDCEIVDSTEGKLECVRKLMMNEKRFVICNYEHLRAQPEEKIITDAWGVPIHKKTEDNPRAGYAEFLVKRPWHRIICDEAHKMRNMDTDLYRGAKILFNHFQTIPVLFLTGTPLVNTPEDLYALLHLLYPSRFASKNRFLFDWFVQTSYSRSAKAYRHRDVDKFQEFISQYMIRRMRKDVIDLPPIKKIDVPIVLQGKQRKMYESMRDLYFAEISEQESVSAMAFIAQLTRLKQICLSPNLIAGEACEGAKTDQLLDMLEDIDFSNGKVVISSNYTKFIRPLKALLESKGYGVGIITGDQSEDERSDYVDRFQNGDDLQIFILSEKAGGEAITLTRANTFIYMDKGWTAASEDQVFGRIYRIGQEAGKVFKYYLRAEDTVEQYIEEVIDNKRKMFEQSVPVTQIRRILYGK